MDQITLGVFSPSVLLDVARSTGRLAAAGLDVRDRPVPSSPAQFAHLRDGTYDAVFTSPDNVLAYRFLPANPLGELLDVEIVCGVDRGLGLCLGIRPGAGNLGEIAGGRLGVDVPNSGFAFVAYALLESAGMSRYDFDIIALGSTPRRATALRSGGCDATVLNAGNELAARGHGCTLVDDVTRLGPYLGTVLAGMREAPGAAAVDRLAATLSATATAIIGGELDSAATESAVRVLGLTAGEAAEHVAVLRDPARGLIDDGSVDPEALNTLVGLRRRFLPVPQLDDLPTRYGGMLRHSRST